jgi:4-hydroxymandelate oxidase
MPLAPLERALDYRALAQARLDAGVWRHLQDGDGAADEAALAGARLMPRPLRSVAGGHTRLNLFGQALEHPIVLAPVAYQRLFHADGEVATAMAAAAQGGQMAISSLASLPLEAIVQASRDAGAACAPWFQLYWQNDRPRTLRLLHRAAAAGCPAVVFTVDAPIKRATMELPADIRAVNLEADARPVHARAGGSVVFDGWMARAPTWDDLRWLRGQTTLPLLVKGLLHPDDAAMALELGCDGIVVSTHGGRVLDGATVSLAALPAIVERIQGRIPVLFDSGIRSGRDVFVALAHGAAAVLVGRPYVWGLASHGALGAAHVIRLLRDELEMTMALMGCATLADVGT